MVAFAGALLATNLINNYLAPDYRYLTNGTSYSSSATPATWPVATPGNAAGTSPTPAAFFDAPGQLSTTITIGDGGALLVGWGFEGYNNSSTASSIRIGINLSSASGFNTQAPSTDLSAMTSNSGLGNAGAHHASRWHIFTGLAKGVVTTVKTQAYMSSTTGAIFVDNQWLFVSQFY